MKSQTFRNVSSIAAFFRACFDHIPPTVKTRVGNQVINAEKRSRFTPGTHAVISAYVYAIIFPPQKGSTMLNLVGNSSKKSEHHQRTVRIILNSITRYIVTTLKVYIVRNIRGVRIIRFIQFSKIHHFSFGEFP